MVGGPSDHYDYDYSKTSASWQQRLAKSTYIEIAGAYENSLEEDWQPVQRGDYEVFIDNNYYLPTQRASENPDPTKPLNRYFGVPYLESTATFQHRDRTLTQYRATLTNQFNLGRMRGLKGLDLGKLTAVAFHYYRKSDTFFEQPVEVTKTSVLASGSVNDDQNNVRRRYYLLPGQPVTFPYVDPLASGISQAADSAYAGNIKPAVSTGFGNRLSPIYNPETTKSYAAIAQWELLSRRLILTGGIRQDDITSTNFVFSQDPVTRLFGGWGQGAFNPAVESSVTNSNLGAVVRVASWLDVYANSATNTVGASSNTYNIFRGTLPNQEGEGYDMGLRAFLLKDRVVVKLNSFNSRQLNRISNPLRDPALGIGMARSTGYVELYLDGMTTNGYGDKVAGALRFTDYPGTGLWTDVESDRTKGYELEATMNFTRQLRLMANLSYNDATLDSTYKYTRQWYDQFVLPYRGDTAITSKIANPAINATRTIGTLVTGIERRLAYHEGQVGGPRLRGSNWMANLVGSYSFDHGALKGARVGGSVRWREAPSIGYPEVAGNFDVDNAFIGKDSLTTDAFISYGWRRRSLGRYGNWSVALRVRNVLDDSEPVPVSAVDDGTGHAFYLQRIYVAPRTYELTASMRF
jgi:hypothetical protein